MLDMAGTSKKLWRSCLSALRSVLSASGRAWGSISRRYNLSRYGCPDGRWWSEDYSTQPQQVPGSCQLPGGSDVVLPVAIDAALTNSVVARGAVVWSDGVSMCSRTVWTEGDKPCEQHCLHNVRPSREHLKALGDLDGGSHHDAICCKCTHATCCTVGKEFSGLAGRVHDIIRSEKSTIKGV